MLVQYYQQNDTYKALLHYMNTTLTGLFTLECIMKIFSFGFRVTIVTKDTAVADRRRGVKINFLVGVRIRRIN